MYKRIPVARDVIHHRYKENLDISNLNMRSQLLRIFRSQLRWWAFRLFESTQIRPPRRPKIIIILKINHATMSNYVDNYKTKTFWASAPY